MRILSPSKMLQRRVIVISSCIVLLAAAIAFNIAVATGELLRDRPSPFVHLGFLTQTASPNKTALQIAVLRSSNPFILARPEAEISIQANFNARFPLSHEATLVLSLVGADGRVAGRVENNLNNRLTILPTSRWTGPIAITTAMTLPDLTENTYSIRASLIGPGGPLGLTPGSGVTQDASFRYSIGTLKIDASAPPPNLISPSKVDLTGYHLTFDEPFTNLSISDSATNDGARWYATNEQCCMSTTDGTATAMAHFSSPQNPYSLMPGNGLTIRLQRNGNEWTSGVLTSVDSHGKGFSQQYGYFEMKAKFPPGENTWPAFWLRNTATKSHDAPKGEIDIVEYIANPRLSNTIATTLHDWSNNTAPAASRYRVPLPTNGFHTYGMMWTAATMSFYFDGAITFSAPTPSIMNQPYYLLVDLGIGSGYPTDRTPASNDLQIEYIRAYARDVSNPILPRTRP